MAANSVKVGFTVALENKLDQNLALKAYVFHSQNGLITTVPLTRDGEVQLELTRAEAKHARVFVAPGSHPEPSATLHDMARLHAHEVDVEHKAVVIPEAVWTKWRSRSWLIRGRVQKSAEAGGGVSRARVHIFRVESLRMLLDRLDDSQILQLRDELEAVMGQTFVPRHFVPDPARPDVDSRDVSKLHQPAPDSVGAVRRLLQANVSTLLPFLCYWNWLCPMFVREEVAVAETGETGCFEAKFENRSPEPLPSFYFTVEYLLKGAWSPVYNPDICCGTYWNFTSGREIAIPIHDPRVPACNRSAAA